MSIRTPLEIVQSAYAAFGRGDVPAFLAELTPDVRWQFTGAPEAPYTGTFVGHDAVQAFLGGVAATDDIRAFEPRRFLAGPGHVTVIGWEDTVVRTTGRAFQVEWVHVFEVRGDRISGFWGLYDTAPAARAMAT